MFVSTAGGAIGGLISGVTSADYPVCSESELCRAIKRLESLGYTVKVVVCREGDSPFSKLATELNLRRNVLAAVVGSNIALSTSRAANDEETRKRKEKGPLIDPKTREYLPQNVSRRHLLTTIIASAVSGVFIGHNYGNLINQAGDESEVKKLIALVLNAGYQILPPNSITRNHSISGVSGAIPAIVVHDWCCRTHLNSVLSDLRREKAREKKATV